MSKKNGKFFNIPGSKRGSQISMEKAMPSLFEALIELITNVDDSYEVLNSPNTEYNGDCQIIYKRGGKKIPTTLSVGDKGTGMTKEKLLDVLKSHGDKRKNLLASRGFFGRGLIDVSYLGEVEIHTIKDGLYNFVKIEHLVLKGEIVEDNQKVTNKHRKLIGTKKHGTRINLTIPINSPSSSNPLSSTIEENLPMHYALRNILINEKGPFQNTLNIKYLNKTDPGITLQYIRPKAEQLVKNKEIILNPKQGLTVKAYFDLFRTETPLSDKRSDEYTDYGILLTGKKTIHEKCFLDSRFTNDPLAKRYFGSLRCEYIDVLANDWEDKREKDLKHTNDNPYLIIDDERIRGLRRSHPFVKNHLFKQAVQILDNYIAKDREKEGSNLTDSELEKDMDKKMKLLNGLSKDIERDNQVGNGKGKFGQKEWLAIPNGLNIKVGDTATVTIYTFKKNIEKSNIVTLKVNEKDNKYINIKKHDVKLLPLIADENKVKATFELEGIEEKKDIQISFLNNNSIKTQINVNVFIEKNRNFENNLEFEFENYNVSHKGTKNIKIFAKYPDLIDKNNTVGKISMDNYEAIKTKNECFFNIVPTTNYAVSKITIQGIKNKDTSNLFVEVAPYKSKTKIKVTDKKEVKGHEFKWQIVDEDLGKDERAAWGFIDRNILKITTRNKLVRKYLGSSKPVDGSYPYSKSIAWKMFLNDMLAEKFAEKLIDLVATNRPSDYVSLTKFGRNEIDRTVAQVQDYYNKAKRQCVLELHHSENFSEGDLKK